MTGLSRISTLERSVLDSSPETAGVGLDVLVEEIAKLRPLPPIAAQVLQIAEGETFSAHELAQAISSDPALIARVLRIANSPYYGFPRRITTIRDAVVLLGFRQVRSTLIATSAMRAMASYEGIDTTAFWRHSVTVGLLADLSSRTRCVRPAEAFTAGVLHNLGRLALDHARPADFRRARRFAEDYHVPVHIAERRLFGFTDADVGGALALRWGFPEDLAVAIARHADAPATAEEATSLAGVVSRARTFAMAHGISDGVDRLESASGCASSSARVSASCATMSVMSPDDLPDTDAAAALTTGIAMDTLDRLVTEQGGLESVMDRAAAFVEHTVSGP